MWYSQGTVAVTANSATATGSGTAFLGNVRVGDGITIAGSTAIHEVTGVTSNTQLTFAPAYAGSSGSGKAYRVAPVQGYDRDLADAFNQLRLQFGNQLAALQPWATAPTPAQAREALGANDAGSLTTGLLDIARIPATLTPDKAFRRGNILGTVSQSGGTPTGAIIERGSNANGEYVRFADGTQICTRTVSLGTYTEAKNGQALGDFPMPSSFVAPPVVTASVHVNSTLASYATALYGTTGVTGSSIWLRVATRALQINSDSAVPVTLGLYAIGRWY